MFDFEEIKIDLPELPFDKEYNKKSEEIRYNISSKSEALKKINEYTEEYFKIVLSSEIMFRYDPLTKTFIEDNQKYLNKYIKSDKIDIYLKDKEKLTFEPLKEFSKIFIVNNGWDIICERDKPQLFKNIYDCGNYTVEKKFINVHPTFPLYLTENQKPFEEYGKEQKEWVNDVFNKLMKHNLCSDNERDFEYMKNWFIRKALMIRNETAIVLQTSTQGVGKTTFSLILHNMFCENSHIVEITHHCTWLKEKFNTQLKGKILISIEELPRLNTSDWHDAGEKLKDFITNGKITLEGKLTNAEEGVPLLVDFVITSNGFHVPLEGNDRRYFVPKVFDGIIKNSEEEKIIRSINNIVKEKKDSKGNKLSKRELNEYYRCLYAYCVENYDKDFDIMKVPATEQLIENNNKKMNLLFKYIKEFYLKSTNNIIKNEDTGEYYYKIFIKHLTEDLIKFIKNVEKNPELLKTYGYSENKFKEYIKNGMPTPNKVSILLKGLFNSDEQNYFKKETKNENKNNIYLLISYNELLDKYKEKDLVSNEEYEELKEKIKGINNSNSISNNNDNDNIEELIYHKDIYSIYNELKSDFDKVKKENEELKEILEEKTRDAEIKNKEIEKIKKELESKDNELEKIKKELKSKDNEFDKEKIKELIKPKINNIFKKYNECIKCKYSKTNESEQEELFIKSLNTSKKLRDSFIEKKEKEELGFNPLLIEKQNKEEKEIKSIFEDLLKF